MLKVLTYNNELLKEKSEKESIQVNVKAPVGLSSLCSHKIELEVCSEQGRSQGDSTKALSLVIKIPEENVFLTTEFLIGFIIIIAIIIAGVVLKIHRKKNRLKAESI